MYHLWSKIWGRRYYLGSDISFVIAQAIFSIKVFLETEELIT